MQNSIENVIKDEIKEKQEIIQEINAGLRPKVGQKLQQPVHSHLSWLLILAIMQASLLVMATAFAQTENTIEQTASVPPAPIVEPQPNQTWQQPINPNVPVNQQLPQPVVTCAPGTVCDNQQPNQQPMMPQQPSQNWQQPMMGQEGQSAGGQGQMMPSQGPSEEEQQKLDEERFTMMKKNFSRFIKEMARFKNKVSSYEKKGVTIVEELKNAIAGIDVFSNKVKEAADADELQEAMDNFQDSMDVIHEWMPKLPRLAQLPKMLKQADKELAKVKRIYTADERKIKAKKIDLSEILASFKSAIDQQAGLLEEIKNLSKTEPETALEKVEEEFYPGLDNMWENDRIIQTTLNITSGLSQIGQEVKKAERIIKNLKKKKIDTVHLEDLLNTRKSQFDQLKQLAKTKPIDTEAVIETVDALMASSQEFNDEVEDLTGQSNVALPQMPKEQEFRLNLPDGYDTENQNTSNFSGKIDQGKQTCNINGMEVPGKCEDLESKNGNFKIQALETGHQ